MAPFAAEQRKPVFHIGLCAPGQSDFVRELLELLGASEAQQVAELVLDGLLTAGGAELTPARGRCACGRAALILPRCPACTREQHADQEPPSAAAEALAEESEEDAAAGEVLAAVGRRLSFEPRGPISYLAACDLDALRPRVRGRWIQTEGLAVFLAGSPAELAAVTLPAGKPFRMIFPTTRWKARGRLCSTAPQAGTSNCWIGALRLQGLPWWWPQRSGS